MTVTFRGRNTTNKLREIRMDVSFNIITELILLCEITKYPLNKSLFDLEGCLTDNLNYSPLSDKSTQILRDFSICQSQIHGNVEACPHRTGFSLCYE